MLHRERGSVHLPLLFIALLVIAAGAMIYLRTDFFDFGMESNVTNEQVEVTPEPQVKEDPVVIEEPDEEPEHIEEPQIVPLEEPSKEVFEIAIKSDEPVDYPYQFQQGVKSMLNAPMVYTFSKSSLLNEPSNVNSFVVIINEGEAKVGDVVTKDNLTITFEQDLTSKMKYFEDHSYCEVDEDCTGTYNYCTGGSFNDYHLYDGFGCGPDSAYSLQGLNRDDVKAQYSYCSNTTNGYFNAEVVESACINNKCKTVEWDLGCAVWEE